MLRPRSALLVVGEFKHALRDGPNLSRIFETFKPCPSIEIAQSCSAPFQVGRDTAFEKCTSITGREWLDLPDLAQRDLFEKPGR